MPDGAQFECVCLAGLQRDNDWFLFRGNISMTYIGGCSLLMSGRHGMGARTTNPGSFDLMSMLFIGTPLMKVTRTWIKLCLRLGGTCAAI